MVQNEAGASKTCQANLGDLLAHLIPVTTQVSGTRLSNQACSVVAPPRASDFETLKANLFAATFHGARPNLITLGAIGWIIHLMPMVGEITHRDGSGIILRFELELAMLFTGPDHVVEVPIP
jgi:hypothetical protein